MLQLINKKTLELTKLLTKTHPVSGILCLTGLFLCIALATSYKSLILCGILFVLSLILLGLKSTAKSLIYSLFTVVFITIITTLTYHQGENIFLYINDKPITLEGISRGINSGIIIISLMLFFRLFNLIIDTSKFIFLFGRFFPAITLMISMAITFMKRYSSCLKDTVLAHETMGISIKSGSIIRRIKNGAYIYSGFLGLMLENSIDTASSMNARGYSGRNAIYNPYDFDTVDIILVLLIIPEILFIII